MEDITDVDYGKKKSFEIRNLGEYHNLYVQGGILLLAYVFETFRNMCLEIYELDHPKCLLAPGLVQPQALKKAKVKLDLLTGIDLLL